MTYLAVFTLKELYRKKSTLLIDEQIFYIKLKIKFLIQTSKFV